MSFHWSPRTHSHGPLSPEMERAGRAGGHSFRLCLGDCSGRSGIRHRRPRAARLAALFSAWGAAWSAWPTIIGEKSANGATTSSWRRFTSRARSLEPTGSLVLIGTIVTRLLADRAGREGTAVQMSTAAWLGRCLRMDGYHVRLLLMAGISGGFRIGLRHADRRDDLRHGGFGGRPKCAITRSFPAWWPAS